MGRAQNVHVPGTSGASLLRPSKHPQRPLLVGVRQVITTLPGQPGSLGRLRSRGSPGTLIGSSFKGNDMSMKPPRRLCRLAEAQHMSSYGGTVQSKTTSVDMVETVIASYGAFRPKVVWTNGCFDILHVGHIAYLQRARSLGDILIVGLNGDASVRRIKGPGRPINRERDRATVLAALECVSYVIVFDTDTPMPVLRRIRPDVYVKGGDYTLASLVQEERAFVESYGGHIVLIPTGSEISTTKIIRQIEAEQEHDDVHARSIASGLHE